MRVRLPAVSWRIVASAVLSLLCVLAVLGVVGVEFSNGNRATSKATLASLSSRGSARMMGTVDLRKLSTMTAGQTASGSRHVTRDRMTQQQRAAYWAQAQRGAGIPKAPVIGSQPSSTKSATDPKFLGGAVIPPALIVTSGLDTPKTGVVDPPDGAAATDLSYLMEGTDPAIAIYRTSTGALAYGPYTADSFFQPVKHAGDTFSDPQMNYDVMRDHWIVTYLEWTPGGLSYLDLAVSTSNSPTQPAPGAQYHEFQIATTFLGGNTACDYQTLGVEYYSLTITCVEFDTSNAFKGNTTIVFDKNSLLSGGTATYYTFNNTVSTSLNTCSGPCPAFRLSPAIEDGVQDSEFIVATDAGYGVTSSNVTLCALTHLRNIATIAPTYTCGVVDLGVSYSDPVAPRQPGGTLSTFGAFGTEEMYFKAGRLYFALTTAITGPRDGILWAELQPQLTTQAAHNPQWINGADYVQTGMYYFSDPNTDVYVPTVMGTDENDMSLVFNYSGNTTSGLYPSIGFTGRKVSDAPGTMGQGTSATAASGISTGGNWSSYAGCAIPLNSVTRGSVWCAFEYESSGNAWKTRLIALRLE
jgi:hypothetical protein